MLVPVILFFFGKYLFIRRLRSWKANNLLYRAQHGQALSLLLLCFVLQWSDDQDSPSARCNKPIKGTFTAHPRLVVGQIVGTFDLGEQRRLISPDTGLKILFALICETLNYNDTWILVVMVPTFNPASMLSREKFGILKLTFAEVSMDFSNLKVFFNQRSKR